MPKTSPRLSKEQYEAQLASEGLGPLDYPNGQSKQPIRPLPTSQTMADVQTFWSLIPDFIAQAPNMPKTHQDALWALSDGYPQSTAASMSKTSPSTVYRLLNEFRAFVTDLRP